MLAQMMKFGDDTAEKGFDERFWQNHSMMWWGGSNQITFWFFNVLWVITWILIIVALVALIRWLWKKGDHRKG